jgi:molecular chaperone DnaK
MADAKISKEQLDDVIFVGGSTRIPKVEQIVKDFFGKAPNKSVNPDEVVSIGAAIQGGVLAGDVTDVLLLDVTPLSLGIETMGGIATRIIERNTTIPTKRSQVFSTAEDNQTAVEIRVVQGEREFARDNKLLGQFKLDGIPAAPRGVPQVEVTFDIDANGIVNVSAKDKASGKEQKITITSGGGLSKEEINKMVHEAEIHAESDRKLKDTIEKRNKLDTTILEVEKTIKENREKIAEADIKTVETALESAKQTLKDKAEDAQALQTATDELLQASYKIAEQLYKDKPQDDNNNNNDDQNKQGPIDAEVS